MKINKRILIPIAAAIIIIAAVVYPMPHSVKREFTAKKYEKNESGEYEYSSDVEVVFDGKITRSLFAPGVFEGKIDTGKIHFKDQSISLHAPSLERAPSSMGYYIGSAWQSIALCYVLDEKLESCLILVDDDEASMALLCGVEADELERQFKEAGLILD